METRQLIESITDMPKLLFNWECSKQFNCLLRSYYPFVLMSVILNWIKDVQVCLQFNLTLQLALNILNSNQDFSLNDSKIDEFADVSLPSCKCDSYDFNNLFDACGISNTMDFKPINFFEENIIILDVTKYFFIFCIILFI